MFLGPIMGVFRPLCWLFVEWGVVVGGWVEEHHHRGGGRGEIGIGCFQEGGKSGKGITLKM